MIFNLVLLILLGTIAFFHYTQGFFSAALSALIAVVAAVMAVSYHEQIVPLLVTHCPDWAVAISLVGLFAAVYIVLRILFDRLCPGNIRFPLLVDKIGAGVVGIIAGLFATGVLALAGQSMAFGPAVGGYARAQLQDRPGMTIHANDNSAAVDTFIADELVGDTVNDPDHINHLWFHQDELVTGLVGQLSSGGPLDSGNPLSAAHPDYPTEMFADRLGVQLGAVRAAPVTDTDKSVTIKTCFHDLPQARFDGMLPALRPTGYKLPDLAMGDKSNWLIEIAVTFTNGGLNDSDGLIRLSLANVRLCTGGVDYYPVGELCENLDMAQSRPDDPLIIDTKEPKTVVFVFVVAPQIPFGPPTAESKEKQKFVDGSFIEIKNFARRDLSGHEISSTGEALKQLGYPARPGAKELGGILRQTNVIDHLADSIRPMPGAPVTPS